jgi:DNA-binding transcriptional MerR regulator
MSYSNDSQNVLARREVVARLRIRGMSVRAIAEALATNDPPFVGTDGNPLSKTTVANDLVALREQWRTEAAATIADHQAEQLATLREVQREAWKKQDLDTVLKSHDRIAKLLGSDAPERHEHRVGAIDEATAQAAFDRVAAFIAKQQQDEPPIE